MKTKNRADRLKQVRDLAKREERSELAALGQIQNAVNDSVNRLDELESYRRDYSNSFSIGEELTPARWQDYQSFLSRINEAVAVQKDQVQVGNEAREAHRQRWIKKRQKLDSIERVLERYRQAQSIEDERKDQRLLDDVIRSRACAEFYSEG